MTSKLTRERIEQYANDPRMCNINDEIREMARMALAALDSETVISDCDPEVFEKGASACLVAIPKETAEVICKGISAVTGCKVDWHYIGGRVHIKALRLAPQPAPVVLKDHQIHELVNQLRGVAIKYHATGQLREQIARVVRAATRQTKSLTTINHAPALVSLPKKGESLSGSSPVNDVTAGKQLTNGDVVTSLDRQSVDQSSLSGNSPVIPEGCVMVPKNETLEMAVAGGEVYAQCESVGEHPTDAARQIWREMVEVAMLAAARHDIPALNPIQSVDTVPDWIPVSERMPEDAQWCLVNTAYGYHVQCWSKGQGWLGDEISIQNCDVTHWMLLPSAPQEVK